MAFGNIPTLISSQNKLCRHGNYFRLPTQHPNTPAVCILKSTQRICRWSQSQDTRASDRVREYMRQWTILMHGLVGSLSSARYAKQLNLSFCSLVNLALSDLDEITFFAIVHARRVDPNLSMIP